MPLSFLVAHLVLKQVIKKPCSCLKESSWAKKRICNFRTGKKKGDYVETCADESHGYSDAIAKKVYKDCMEEKGF